MKNNLIERYIYAVTKRMPAKIQKDVSKEIEALIDDMLAERCGDITPSDKDIRVVLTELGSPSELAEKYDTSEKKCLIGAPYYATYKYVLKIVLICIGIGMIVTSVISALVDGFENYDSVEIMLQSVKFWIDMFTEMFVTLSSGVVSGFTIVTLLFAFFYHNDIKIDSEKLDDLPSVPKKKISIADCIVGIAFSVAFAVVFIAAPQIFGVIIDGKTFISILNVQQVKALWYLVVIFSLLGIIREVVKLIERQYSKKVMITTIITDVCSAVVAAFWLINEKIVNNNFVSEVADALEKDVPNAIFHNFNYFFLFCILLALTIDIIETVVKTLKNKD